jgi:succinoglycan biosynthesis transport protein ExoP
VSPTSRACETWSNGPRRLNDLVLRFENRYRELALESSFPVASGRILSRALPPRDPAAPRAVPTLAAGMFLGLLLGLAAAVLREARETGFRSGADVTRDLGLPFLGYVPPATRSGTGPGRLRSALGRPAEHPGRASPRTGPGRRPSAPDRGLPPRHLAEPHAGHPRPSSNPAPAAIGPQTAEFDQAVRGVFSLLHTRRLQRHGRVIAVASLQAGEDSAAIAVELARQTIRAGRRCLLVDGDLTGAELSNRLGLTGAEGTLDVLDGACGLEAALRSDLADDLEVLAAGQGDEPDRALAYFTEFGELIGDLAEGYDDVVLHLPPLLDMPEAQGLLARADHVLLAVAWGRTPRRLVRAFVAEAPGLRGPGAAVVLSRVALRRLSRYGVIRPRPPVWKSGRRTAKST